ncbi:MAG TPA: type I methionyl aminopeptidase [Flavilitoribacter sp.]|nr:type I methionyl aminopeptidase [Flavilitoribacter sp.]HMQ88017.1 type I methionyl aminopeptidase [Flavilitoribacter sp.]
MGMIIYKTDEEVELIRKSCLVVSKVLAEVGAMLRPGITGVDLDKTAEEVIRDHGGIPSFKGYKGFPAALCVSLNEQVVHGIPDKDQPFKDGDVVSVDCGVFLNGFHGDSAYTFAVGDVGEDVVELLSVTNTSLYKGIEQAVSGKRIGDIGATIQEYVERHNGFGIVRELVGHGLGRDLHEAPEVPNFGKRGKGVKLREGLVIAIEPMVNMGQKRVKTARDGWTVFAKDHKPSAHFEHTVVIRKTRADILSDHSIVEQAVANNSNLKEIGLKMELA